MGFAFSSDGMLRALDALRSIGGLLGVRAYTTTVRVDVWDGGRPGLGARTRTETPLLLTDASGNKQNPLVRQLSNADAVLSGGVYTNQDMRIGPLTPPYTVDGTANGVPYALLDPDLNIGTALYFKLVGPGLPPGGMLYERIRDEADSLLHIYIVVRATAVQDP